MKWNSHILHFIQNAPSTINSEDIVERWEALSNYNVNNWVLPLPVWARRPYEHDGFQAWQTLRGDLARDETERPFCIYIHIPFCARKCGFCDSYSFQVRANIETHTSRYLQALIAEINLWSQQGNLKYRPVSTVHLGGGTPAFLGADALAKLLGNCREYFHITCETELAIETTVSSLTPAMISALHQLGFRRLHIGVQTLEEPSRTLIGRVSPPQKVLEKVAEMRSLGWVVSVDLICGLPQQTLQGFIAGIDDLVDAGANGFSIYELLIYPQNRRWAEKFGLTQRDHLPNYLMFQAGAQRLAQYGFKKNLFNHWADSLDQNIYFTFPLRGEDLLAVGTIADGVFGRYHYRHPRYADYLRLTTVEQPGLEGGLYRNAKEERLHPFFVAIQAGFLTASMRRELEAFGGSHLVQRWLQNQLVEERKDGALALTDGGSWFTGNLIAELSAAVHLEGER